MGSPERDHVDQQGCASVTVLPSFPLAHSFHSQPPDLNNG